MSRDKFPWGTARVLAVGVLVFISLFAWLIVSGERNYQDRRRERGGRVVTVRSSEVCVDESDRVILT